MKRKRMKKMRTAYEAVFFYLNLDDEKKRLVSGGGFV